MSELVEEWHESVDALAEAVADRIVDGILSSAVAGRRYLLGCPGGRTPKPIFEALSKRCADATIDCSHVVIVMMDDYLEPGAATPTLVPANAHYSCRRFAEMEIRLVINRGLTAELAIPAESVWFADPADPSAYDARLGDAGGIDLFIVASGASDGHVAFCGPGADPAGVTAVVPLAQSTRIDNMVTFPQFESIDEVPIEGVTVGLGTIRLLSKAVLMILHGPDKRESWRRLSEASSYESDWPATFIHECKNATLLTDALARSDR